ncbi:MAG: cation:proton antiporter [Pseudomonadota bacterium]
MIVNQLVILAIIVIAYGVFSGRLSRSFVSAPMVFMLIGLIFGLFANSWLGLSVGNQALEVFAELTLGLILFADAASTDGRRLLRDNRIPLRLLLIALPLMIACGTVIAHFVFPQLSLAEHALIAAVLAPTDAALGLAVVKSKAVPERIRQSVLVESGLNDGLALPAVLLFAAFAFAGVEASGTHGGEAARGLSYWIGFVFQQISVGLLCGVIGGRVFGKIIDEANNRDLIAHDFRNFTSLGVAVLLLFGTTLVGGNGFIAAFVGGLMFGNIAQKRGAGLTEFVEETGNLFSLLIFFFFGAVILPAALPLFTVFCILYAVLSLTVIRLLPTFLSLIGTGLSVPGKLFIGWFGPRGLASILFLYIAVGHDDMARLTDVETVVYIAVFLSIILHGISAPGLSSLYGKSEAAKRDSINLKSQASAPAA